MNSNTNITDQKLSSPIFEEEKRCTPNKSPVVLGGDITLLGEICKRKYQGEHEVVAAFYLGVDIKGDKKMVKMLSRKSLVKQLEYKQEVICNKALEKSPFYVVMDYSRITDEVFIFDNGEVIEEINYIVTPFCEKGTLLSLLMKLNDKKLMLRVDAQQYLCSQLVKAIHHMQTVDMMAHCDIKPDNVVFTEDFKLALIDFAVSKHIGRRGKESTGTFNYNPPEVYDMDPSSYFYCRQVDMFQLGVTLAIITSQAPPFTNSLDKSYYDYMTYLYWKLCTQPQQQGGVDMLIYSCLQPNPENRLKIDQAIKYSFIKEAPEVPTKEILAQLAPFAMVDMI